jgi:hypothetical protein
MRRAPGPCRYSRNPRERAATTTPRYRNLLGRYQRAGRPGGSFPPRQLLASRRARICATNQRSVHPLPCRNDFTEKVRDAFGADCTADRCDRIEDQQRLAFLSDRRRISPAPPGHAPGGSPRDARQRLSDGADHNSRPQSRLEPELISGQRYYSCPGVKMPSGIDIDESVSKGRLVLITL